MIHSRSRKDSKEELEEFQGQIHSCSCWGSNDEYNLVQVEVVHNGTLRQKLLLFVLGFQETMHSYLCKDTKKASNHPYLEVHYCSWWNSKRESTLVHTGILR